MILVRNIADVMRGADDEVDEEGPGGVVVAD